MLRSLLAASLALSSFTSAYILPTSTARAESGERSLYLYYTHTKETRRITFKRNGRYDQAGLAELNKFLRDWRRNEPAKMDPALFDLVWTVYQKVGASNPIHIVSAYRSPATNEMLRSRSSAVAKNSRHTMGMAMDFFIPGVPLTKLRETAMRLQVGGVGFYPTSGSPFVHLDTGNVRAWPRMTRAQLQKVFPDGRTLHLPTDGKPLSDSGRQYAMAEWKKCHSVPCGSTTAGSSNFAVASNGGNGGGRTLADLFFGKDEDEEDVTPASGPAARSVATLSVTAPSATAPVPHDRPGSLPANIPFAVAEADAPAPVPATKSQAIILATAAPQPAMGAPAIAVASLDADAPQPRQLMSRDRDSSPLLTAYAPEAGGTDAQRAVQDLIERADRTREALAAAPAEDQDARRALDMLLERSQQAAAPATPRPGADGLRTASVAAPGGNLLEQTWAAVTGSRRNIDLGGIAAQPRTPAPALVTAAAGLTAREGELFAPDIELVTEMWMGPAEMKSAYFAVLFEPEQSDLNPSTEMGSLTVANAFDTDPAFGLSDNQFRRSDTVFVASR